MEAGGPVHVGPQHGYDSADDSAVLRQLGHCGVGPGAVGGLMSFERTLYSLRHTYATFALLDGMEIHTLAKQLGNSAAMIERHYSKLTPMLVAGKLG